jgi:hypothetical protein
VVPDLIRRLCLTDFGAIGNLSHNFMTKFNQSTANNPHVRYFAWAGKISIPTTKCKSANSTPLLTYSLGSLISRETFVLSRVHGSTDGVVEVDSAMWANDLGPGTHLGTLRGLDQ